MSKIEVLVACMHQADDCLYKQMNLQTDAVLANQTNEFRYAEFVQPNGCVAKLVSTPDRGVGKNRNKAFIFASGEYLLCADADMVYEDGYEDMVLSAYEQKPDADIIVFDLAYMNRLTPGRKAGTKFKRLRIWNSMRYGAARIAIRKTAYEKANLAFSHLYGGGAPYSSGEDSLFICEALRKGLKMYYCPVIIAKVKQEESTWFCGYTDKFFVDKGILLANAFPWMKHLLVYYFAFGLRKVSKDYGYWKICSLMRQGIKLFSEL